MPAPSPIPAAVPTPEQAQQNKRKVLVIAVAVAVVAILVAVLLLLREADNSSSGGGSPSDSSAVTEPGRGESGISDTDAANAQSDGAASVGAETSDAVPGTQSGNKDSSVGASNPGSEGISVNMEALQMIGIKNSELIEINGKSAESYVADGSAWVDYVGKRVPFPLQFGVGMDFDTFLEIAYNENLAWNTNLWPEDAIVSVIMLWGDEVNFIFHSDKPITFEALSGMMEQLNELTFWAEDEQIHDPYGFDVWVTEFSFDCYGMFSTFKKEGNDLVLFEMIIWEAST